MAREVKRASCCSRCGLETHRSFLNACLCTISHKTLKEAPGVSDEEVIVGSLNGRRAYRGATGSRRVSRCILGKINSASSGTLVSLQLYGAVGRLRVQDNLVIFAGAMREFCKKFVGDCVDFARAHPDFAACAELVRPASKDAWTFES